MRLHLSVCLLQVSPFKQDHLGQRRDSQEYKGLDQAEQKPEQPD